MRRYALGLAALAISTSLLAGCGNMFGDSVDSSQTDTDATRRAEDPYHTNPLYNPQVPAAQAFINKQDSPDNDSFGILNGIFGDNKNKGGGGGGGVGGVAVNSYLWHASLDTMSFMPIASADPFGGTIITDWYSPRGTPNERFKVNIFILNRELRADGVRVTVFRQVRGGDGQWTDAPVDPKTGRDLENSILNRARQIRLSTASNS